MQTNNHNNRNVDRLHPFKQIIKQLQWTGVDHRCDVIVMCVMGHGAWMQGVCGIGLRVRGDYKGQQWVW